MPFIKKEDWEFLEYVTYKISSILYGNAPPGTAENQDIIDFAAYSERIGYEIQAAKDLAGISHDVAKNVVLQLNREKMDKIGIERIFTKQEIREMPKLKDLHYRHRADGCHEFRYRRNGYNKSFCNADYKTARSRALEFCRELNRAEGLYAGKCGLRFGEFAENYMQNVKKKNVGKKTFENNYNRYKNYILPPFAKCNLRDIKAPQIQLVLNDIIDKGYFRTAEDCYYIMRTIFQYAVDNDFIEKSPMRAVKIPMHQREIGKAMPKELEQKFIRDISGHKYRLNFIVLLYTGCRPCELESIQFEKSGFLTFRNRKQHNGKIAFKDIPITPMLAPYIEEIKNALPLPKNVNLAKIFSSFIPGYRMYDLRHTFASRCQECGVPQEVVGRWLGHKSDKITDYVYTHYSDEFMLEQAKKVDY